MLIIYKYAIGTSDIPWGDALKGRPLGKSTGGKMYFSLHNQHSEKVQKALGSLYMCSDVEKGQMGVKPIPIPALAAESLYLF